MFSKISVYAAALFAAAILGGCATSNQVGNPAPLARSGTGYVLTSVVSRNQSYNSELKFNGVAYVHALFYSLAKPTDVAFIATGGGILIKPETSVTEPGGYRTMVLTPVQPGKYKLGRVEGGFVFPEKRVQYETIDSSVIEVREGEVVYAGSVKLITYLGIGLFGQVLPASSNMAVDDEFESDYAVLQSLDPRIKGFKVANGLKAGQFK